MSELIQWGGHGGIAFFVSPTEIRAFKDLTISVSAETEDKTSGGEKYVSKKNSGAYTITLTAVLNAALGVDVQAVALAISESARLGEQGYFYCAGEKLFPSCFMSTDATISNVRVTQNGTWSYAEVSWTLKQCGKYNDDGTDGSNNSSGSGSSGGSSKTGSGASTGKFKKITPDKANTPYAYELATAATDIVARAQLSARNSYNALTAGSRAARNSQYLLTAGSQSATYGIKHKTS